MTNTTVAFLEAVRLNHQLSFKVSGVLAKLLRTQLDRDKLFKCYKNLQAEKKDLGGKVESMEAEKDGFSKVIDDLEVRLKDSKSKLQVGKEKETSMELEVELLLYKKEVVEQHEKGF